MKLQYVFLIQWLCWIDRITLKSIQTSYSFTICINKPLIIPEGSHLLEKAIGPALTKTLKLNTLFQNNHRVNKSLNIVCQKGGKYWTETLWDPIKFHALSLLTRTVIQRKQFKYIYISRTNVPHSLFKSVPFLRYRWYKCLCLGTGNSQQKCLMKL